MSGGRAAKRVVLAAALLLALPRIGSGDGASVRWSPDYASAAQRAKESGGIVLLCFGDPRSAASRTFESTVLSDAAVARAMERFACARVDLGVRGFMWTEHPDFVLAKKLEVSQAPAVVALDPRSGKVLARLDAGEASRRSPDGVTGWLEGISPPEDGGGKQKGKKAGRRKEDRRRQSEKGKEGKEKRGGRSRRT